MHSKYQYQEIQKSVMIKKRSKKEKEKSSCIVFIDSKTKKVG